MIKGSCCFLLGALLSGSPYCSYILQTVMAFLSKINDDDDDDV